MAEFQNSPSRPGARGLSFADYLATGAARLSLGDSQPAGFVRHASLDVDDLRWADSLGTGRVAALFEEHQLTRCGAHQVDDILVAARRVLMPGGRLRIVEPDFYHPLDRYRALIEHPLVRTRFTIDSLSRRLQAAGFAVHGREYYDSRGRFHQAPGDLSLFGLPGRSHQSDPRARDPAIRYSSLIVDAVRLPDADTTPAFDTPPLMAVGDSHVRFLAGRDAIEGYQPGPDGVRRYAGFCARFTGLHLAPATAYNLPRPNSSMRVLEKIGELLAEGELRRGDRVLFSFGEIDCRTHIVRQAELQGRDIPEVARDVCQNYALFLEHMRGEGLLPMVWGAIASTPNEHYQDRQAPLYGTMGQRNHAVRSFNARIADICRERGFPFVSITDRLMTEDGGTRREFYADDIHLSQRARTLLWGVMPD